MKTQFKKNLKLLRKEAKLGQVELANKLGLSKGIISIWENGLSAPNLASLVEIALFFKVSLDELVGMEELKKHKPFN